MSAAAGNCMTILRLQTEGKHQCGVQPLIQNVLSWYMWSKSWRWLEAQRVSRELWWHVSAFAASTSWSGNYWALCGKTRRDTVGKKRGSCVCLSVKHCKSQELHNVYRWLKMKQLSVPSLAGCLFTSTSTKSLVSQQEIADPCLCIFFHGTVDHGARCRGTEAQRGQKAESRTVQVTQI